MVKKNCSLWCFHVIVPPMSTIGSQVVLNSSSSLSITIGQKIVGVATCRFSIHTKIGLLCDMIIVLLEHGNLYHPTYSCGTSFYRISYNKSRIVRFEVSWSPGCVRPTSFEVRLSQNWVDYETLSIACHIRLHIGRTSSIEPSLVT